MKLATIFMLLVAMIVAVSALPKRHPPKMPKPSGNPNFGGYGSFNPRGRRSPDADFALARRDPPRLPKPSGNPNFGSYGSFNPRGRRSPVEQTDVYQTIDEEPIISADWE